MKSLLTIITIIFATASYSQQLKVYKSISNDARPRIIWYRQGKDTLYKQFDIFRANVKDKKYRKINTGHFVLYRDNTVQYYVVDTTLTRKSIYAYYIKILTRKGDTLISPVAIAHNMGRLPKPHLTDFYAVRSGDKKAIELHWQLNYNFSVRTLSIFRSSYGNKDFKKIAELPGDATSYTDRVPLSNHNYYYFILIADFFGYEIPGAVLPASTLFKQKPTPPYRLKIEKTGDKIKLSWHNSDTNLSGYQVYRSVGERDFLPLHTMQSANKKYEEFTDENLHEIAGKRLRYYVVNYSDAYVPSEPSDTLQVFIPGDKNPLPPAEIHIIRQDEGHVKLIWTRPGDNRIQSYNIYLDDRKINRKPVPVYHNYWENIPVSEGKTYTFGVESVGYNGKKSKYKTTATINLLTDYHHLVIDAGKQKDGIVLKWKKYPDQRIEKINLYRQNNKKAILLKVFDNKDVRFTDKKVVRNTTYLYTVYGQLTGGKRVLLNDGVEIRY